MTKVQEVSCDVLMAARLAVALLAPNLQRDGQRYISKASRAVAPWSAGV